MWVYTSSLRDHEGYLGLLGAEGGLLIVGWKLMGGRSGGNRAAVASSSS